MKIKYKEYDEQVELQLSPRAAQSKSPKLIISNRFMRREKYGLNIRKSTLPVFGKEEEVAAAVNPSSNYSSRNTLDSHAKHSAERERMLAIQN